MPILPNSKYDFFSAGTAIDTYSIYKAMREDDPVYYSEDLGGWVLTRYQDVAAALRDERLSADRSSLFLKQIGDLDVRLIQNFLALTSDLMVEKDPPEHTHLRKIANQGFTAKALESWRSIIQATTDRAIERVQARSSMDIVADLSFHLPARIVAEIFGVTECDLDNLACWSKDIQTFWGAPIAQQNIEDFARKADLASAKFITLIRNEIEKRQRNPGLDMISLLVSAYVKAEIDLERLPSLCVLILAAGHVTMTDLIPNGVNVLLQHPQQWQKLKANPALVPAAVEEILRFDISTPFMLRIAKQDVTIGDRLIPSGSIIALGLGAANRDPEQFENPERFEIERSPNEHLGFGPGIHHCLGAVLARMELQIFFRTLVERMPELRFDPDRPAIPQRTSLISKGFKTLPVLF